MSGHAIRRDQLGDITRIGEGGQGIVYRSPGFKTKFTDSLVFKEYKPQAQAEISFDALSAMPRLVEEALSYEDAERLIAMAAWPCAIVEDEGRPVGQVMPAIPDDFSIKLTTARGTSVVNAELQHLLNHRSVLAARGIDITEAQRYSLLLEVANELAFFHARGICVGDISPKNLLFSLTPRVAVYFIDCDAMSVNGNSAMPQAETPGWEVPDGEALATVYADTYKLALLALRLLVGDQEVRNPAHLPARTPQLLRKVITDSLTKAAERRPLPNAWAYILSFAVEDAQQRDIDDIASRGPEAAPPSVPVVRSRPKPQTKITSPASNSTSSARNSPHAVAAPKAAFAHPQASNAPQQHSVLIGVASGVALATIVGLIVWIVFLVSGDDSDSARTRPQDAASSRYSEPTVRQSQAPSPTRPSTSRSQSRPRSVILSAPPAGRLPQGLDSNNQSCAGGISVGHGMRATRGTVGTTCRFAGNVGGAYSERVSSHGPNLVAVSAIGSVGCSTVPGNPKCSDDGQDAFIMSCAVLGGDTWVTCRGGNDAVVYIY